MKYSDSPVGKRGVDAFPGVLGEEQGEVAQEEIAVSQEVDGRPKAEEGEATCDEEQECKAIKRSGGFPGVDGRGKLCKPVDHALLNRRDQEQDA